MELVPGNCHGVLVAVQHVGRRTNCSESMTADGEPQEVANTIYPYLVLTLLFRPGYNINVGVYVQSGYLKF